MTEGTRNTQDGQTPANVEALAAAISDAHAKGIRFGTASLARHILQAGYGKRPNWPASKASSERVTHTLEGRQTWRQVGWHGQTGAFYALDEKPSLTESGSFSPLWILVEDEPPILPDEQESDRG